MGQTALYTDMIRVKGTFNTYCGGFLRSTVSGLPLGASSPDYFHATLVFSNYDS